MKKLEITQMLTSMKIDQKLFIHTMDYYLVTQQPKG